MKWFTNGLWILRQHPTCTLRHVLLVLAGVSSEEDLLHEFRRHRLQHVDPFCMFRHWRQRALGMAVWCLLPPELAGFEQVWLSDEWRYDYEVGLVCFRRIRTTWRFEVSN